MRKRPGATGRLVDPRFLATGGGIVDLFALFPDLPWMWRPPIAEQQRRVLRKVEHAQLTARRTIASRRVEVARRQRTVIARRRDRR